MLLRFVFEALEWEHRSTSRLEVSMPRKKPLVINTDALPEGVGDEGGAR